MTTVMGSPVSRRALVLLTATLAAGIAAPADAHAPLSFADMRAWMLVADTVAVEHLRAVVYVVRDASGAERRRYRSEQLSAARADTAWARRFARTLIAAGPWDSLRRCTPGPPPGDSADAFTAGVSFRSRGRSLGVLLFFRRRCAQLFDAAGPAGAMDITEAAPGLLALVQEALPADSALVALRLAELSPADTAMRLVPATGEVVDELPRALERVSPKLPAWAEPGLEGTVRVLALVGEDGRVRETRVLEPVPVLDAVAAAAVRQWRFEPAKREGRPVPVWIEIPVTFRAR